MLHTTFNSNESEASFDSFNENDELREALAKGTLKPGLNVIVSEEERTPVNDVGKLKTSLERCTLRAPWIERLDMVNELAPLAPEMVLKIEKHRQQGANFAANGNLPFVTPEVDPVENDFRREMLFHRQAQTAVITGIKRLKDANILTKRPADYFGEMCKSDAHMQRMRRMLLATRDRIAKSERVRDIREQRRIGKVIQQQVAEKRAVERRNMLDSIKKIRKGKLSNWTILNDEANDKCVRKQCSKGAKRKASKNTKQRQKNLKFGFGGKKKGSKRNTKQSSMDDAPQRKR